MSDGSRRLPVGVALGRRWRAGRASAREAGPREAVRSARLPGAAAFLMAVPLAVVLAVLAGGVVLPSVGPVPAEDWRHGTLTPGGDAGFVYMAAEGGFAKAEGVDLRMQAFQNDTAMVKALMAGELDSYEGSPVGPLIAGSSGADLKILGCTWPRLAHSLFVREGIESFADLQGKRIGVPAPGSLPELIGRALLRRAGIAASKVRFVPAGSDAERLRAVGAGTIDAAVSADDSALGLELKPAVLAAAGEALPQFPRRCIVTRGDLIRTRRPLLIALMAAQMNAYGFAVSHRDREIALTRRIAGLPPGDPAAEANWRQAALQRAVSPAIEIDLDKLRWLRDLLAQDGHLAARFDPAALTDRSIREAALTRAGK